jgi:hypothetical protein
MNTKFLKARIPSELYEALMARASADGKRLGTYARELLERDASSITTQEVLTRVEAALIVSQQASPRVQPSELDHETRQAVAEVRLIARELAMHANAQIMSRVAAQLKAQSQKSV